MASGGQDLDFPVGEPKFIVISGVVLIDEPSLVNVEDLLFDVVNGLTGVLRHEVLIEAAAAMTLRQPGPQHRKVERVSKPIEEQPSGKRMYRDALLSSSRCVSISSACCSGQDLWQQ
jgi:hypothetical protein